MPITERGPLTRMDRVRNAFAQFEEGEITYGEFVRDVLSYVEQDDFDAFMHPTMMAMEH